MKWAKIIDEYTIELAPNIFYENGKQFVGFSEDFLRAHGYKPLVESQPTSETEINYYQETEDEIQEIWKK